MTRYLLRLVVRVVLAACLAGCGAMPNLATDVLGAAIRERRGEVKDPTAGLVLRPDRQYLRIDQEGLPPSVLVLGYLDRDPGGEIEVWYSARGEVIKIQNGRIVATFGLALDWRAVRFEPAPRPWHDIPEAGELVVRIRDESPGYRYALRQPVRTRPVAGPGPDRLPPALRAGGFEPLRWFVEEPLGDAAQHAGPSRYALGTLYGRAAIVYSEQCLTSTQCLRMTRIVPGNP